MKLISMTDFVLEQDKNNERLNSCFLNCVEYAKFLKRPVELWMFVPCDEYGNVLEEPETYTLFLISSTEEMNTCGFAYRKECEEYQKAKKRCFFNGFKSSIPAWADFQKDFMLFKLSDIKNIEGLLSCSHKTNFELTETAIKMI